MMNREDTFRLQTVRKCSLQFSNIEITECPWVQTIDCIYRPIQSMVQTDKTRRFFLSLSNVFSQFSDFVFEPVNQLI